MTLPKLDKKGLSIVELIATTAVTAVIGGIIIGIIVMSGRIYQDVRINSAIEHEANRLIKTIVNEFNNFDAQEIKPCDPFVTIPNCVLLRNSYDIGFGADGTILLLDATETLMTIKIENQYLYIDDVLISQTGYYLIDSEIGYEDSGIASSCEDCFSGTVTITLTIQADINGTLTDPYTFKTILPVSGIEQLIN